MPPPIHGSSLVGSWLKNSSHVHENLNSKFINILFSKDISSSGKFSFFKFFQSFRILVYLNFNLLFFRPDLCYFALSTTGLAFYRDCVYVLVLKIFKIKIVYHLHNKGIYNFSKSKFNSYLYKFVFKNNKVILLSEYLYYDIEKFVIPENVYFCPNGIPEVNNNLRSNYDALNLPVKILFLSNLIESKGPMVLLKSLIILKSKNIPFEAFFVGGEGDLSYDYVNNFIKSNDLLDSAFVLGKKFDLEKDKIFSESDIFVFPTFYSNECFPLVLLEALQFKLPIVSTNEGGIPSILEDSHNGFLIERQSPEDLAEKLELLINDSDLRKDFGSNGLLKFKSCYTLPIWEKRIKSIIMNELL